MSTPLPFDPIDEAARNWRSHWGEGTAPPMAVVTSIMRAQQIVSARLDDELKPFGIRFARYEALMLLFYSRTGSLPLGKMGARLQVHPTSVTSLIDGLEKLGYVTRAPHPTDRRTTLATITDAGRDVAGRATAALNAIRFGTEGLTDEEDDAVVTALRKLRIAYGDFRPGDDDG